MGCFVYNGYYSYCCKYNAIVSFGFYRGRIFGFCLEEWFDNRKVEREEVNKRMDRSLFSLVYGFSFLVLVGSRFFGVFVNGDVFWGGVGLSRFWVLFFYFLVC